MFKHEFALQLPFFFFSRALAGQISELTERLERTRREAAASEGARAAMLRDQREDSNERLEALQRAHENKARGGSRQALG